MQCPCKKTELYSDCCQKIHHDIRLAKTAKELMQSRYSAFVLAHSNYLHKSHHSKTRPNYTKERKALIDWTKSVHWVKLEILNTSNGHENDSIGTVEFKAYYFENSSLECLHEISSFKKENDHWVYFKKLN